MDYWHLSFRLTYTKSNTQITRAVKLSGIGVLLYNALGVRRLCLGMVEAIMHQDYIYTGRGHYGTIRNYATKTIKTYTRSSPSSAIRSRGYYPLLFIRL
jgi:hypothetical protein